MAEGPKVFKEDSNDRFQWRRRPDPAFLAQLETILRAPESICPSVLDNSNSSQCFKKRKYFTPWAYQYLPKPYGYKNKKRKQIKVILELISDNWFMSLRFHLWILLTYPFPFLSAILMWVMSSNYWHSWLSWRLWTGQLLFFPRVVKMNSGFFLTRVGNMAFHLNNLYTDCGQSASRRDSCCDRIHFTVSLLYFTIQFFSSGMWLN